MRILTTGISGGIGQALRPLAESCGVEVVGLARTPLAGEVAFDLTWSLPAMERTLQHVGTVDGLVALAGADILSPPLRHSDYLERMQALYEVDMLGSVKTVQAVLPHLADQGVIILMGWDQAGLGKSGEAGELYSLAKSAVTGYAKSLAKSLLGRASVYVVAPGWVRTRWGDSLPEAQQARISSHTALGRWQTPAEVARTILALLQFPPGVATGQVIYVNHGDVMPS